MNTNDHFVSCTHINFVKQFTVTLLERPISKEKCVCHIGKK